VGRRKAKKRAGEQEDHLSRGANVATIVGVPLALVALVLAYLALGGGEHSHSKKATRSPRLQHVDLIARNGISNHPGLELLVENRGVGRAVISRAEIKILRVLPIPICFTQGGLGVSEEYGVQLPPDAAPGETIEVPLHQQVAANQADRFRIELGVQEPEEGQALKGDYLFELAVGIVHDGRNRPLGMGTALISLPRVPLGSEFFLEEGGFQKVIETFSIPGPLREFWTGPRDCWRNNARKATLALKSQATRSPELEEALTSKVAPSFSELRP
jgi:hypothetical protein